MFGYFIGGPLDQTKIVLTSNPQKDYETTEMPPLPDRVPIDYPGHVDYVVKRHVYRGHEVVMPGDIYDKVWIYLHVRRA